MDEDAAQKLDGPFILSQRCRTIFRQIEIRQHRSDELARLCRCYRRTQEWRSAALGNTAAKDVRIHHGVGVTLQLSVWSNFKRFDKFAFTFSPFDVAYKDFRVGLTIRLYPNGFTDDEFGFGAAGQL